jgi:hypothetical protein
MCVRSLWTRGIPALENPSLSYALDDSGSSPDAVVDPALLAAVACVTVTNARPHAIAAAPHVRPR